ncbi:hypothetical protein MMC11_007893 [Xylographa trunciseda]|nr:hypothetical protein [Xylographa trunciseda]
MAESILEGYVDSIHQTLILGCSPCPSHNYKGGAFAGSISSDVPVLSCLGRLIKSPLTTAAEKTAFTVQRDMITKLFNLQAKKGPLSFENVVVAGSMGASDRLINVFKDDQRVRGVVPFPDFVACPPPENYNGDPEDVTSLLLQITQNMVELACSSSTGYKGGIFRNTITANVYVTDALGLLSQDSRITGTERAIFETAVIEARKLYDLKLASQKTIQVPGGMYLAHMAWFKPLLEVFDRDFERRGCKSPNWTWYTIMVDDKVVTNMPSNGGMEEEKTFKNEKQAQTAVQRKGHHKSTDFGMGFQNNLKGAFQ